GADRPPRHQHAGRAPDRREPCRDLLPDHARPVAGDGDRHRAGHRRRRRSALTGIRMAVVMACLSAFAVWTFRRGILRLYTTDAAVTSVALSLVGYLV